MVTPRIPSSLAALLPGSPQIHRSAKGTVSLWDPAPGIVFSYVTDVLTAEGALAIETATRRSMARFGPQIIFHDWDEMTDYETEARAQLTQFGMEARKSFDGVHMLVRSKIVQFGVQAANLVVRRIQLYEARAPFEAALRRALADKAR